MIKEKTFYANGPNAISEIEDAVEEWLEEVEDEIDIVDIQEFEDENEHGKIAIAVIYYKDAPPPS